MNEWLASIEKKIKDLGLQLSAWASKSEEPSRKTLGYAKAKKVALLLYQPTDLSFEDLKLEKVTAPLKKDGKEIEVFIFKDFINLKEIEEHPLPTLKNIPTTYLSYRDFSFSGKPIGVELQAFLHTNFDYLLFDANQPSEALLYMLKASNAFCRIGNYHTFFQPQLELSIKREEGSFFGDLLLQYSKALSSTTA